MAPIPLKRIISKMLAEDDCYKNVDDVLADLGSPTLLEAMAPKTISTKKVYAVGLAFGVFIFAPLSWTSLQLFSERALQGSDSAEIISQVTPEKTGTQRVKTQRWNEAIKKASSSVNRALIVQIPEPIIVKPTTNLKKSKTETYSTKKLAKEKGVEKIEVEKVEREPVILRKKTPKHLRFQPNKFSVRSMQKPTTKKTKAPREKSIVEKKSTARKSLPIRLKPKKSVPLSF